MPLAETPWAADEEEPHPCEIERWLQHFDDHLVQVHGLVKREGGVPW